MSLSEDMLGIRVRVLLLSSVVEYDRSGGRYADISEAKYTLRSTNEAVHPILFGVTLHRCASIVLPQKGCKAVVAHSHW